MGIQAVIGQTINLTKLVGGIADSIAKCDIGLKDIMIQSAGAVSYLVIGVRYRQVP